jgi:hypothetical protein
VGITHVPCERREDSRRQANHCREARTRRSRVPTGPAGGDHVPPPAGRHGSTEPTRAPTDRPTPSAAVDQHRGVPTRDGRREAPCEPWWACSARGQGSADENGYTSGRLAAFPLPSTRYPDTASQLGLHRTDAAYRHRPAWLLFPTLLDVLVPWAFRAALSHPDADGRGMSASSLVRVRSTPLSVRP